MRLDDPALVEERQAAGLLQHALDHEHHVGSAGVVFVEDEGDVVLERPGQDAVLEGGDLLALLQHDRVLADEVDARDVAVEIDAHAGPVEARGDLLDMGRLAGAVIARDHDAAVAREAGQDRERRLAVEQVVGVEVRHMLFGLAEGRDLQVRIDAEDLAHGHFHVRRAVGVSDGASMAASCSDRVSRRERRRLSLMGRPGRASVDFSYRPRLRGAISSLHNAPARASVRGRRRPIRASCSTAKWDRFSRALRFSRYREP